MSLVDKFRALYNLPMREAVAIIRNKIVPYNVPPVERLLNNHKLMRSQKVFDFLNRYEIVLERVGDWKRLEFEGAHVLEVGCGPLLGFLPLALFRGASSCTAVEPGFNPAVLHDKRFEKTYFLGIYNDLSNLFGPRMTFDEFMGKVRAVDVRDATILDAGLEGPFDIMFSNSCFEHVLPFEPSIQELGRVTSDSVQFLHLVNFGNHAGTSNPFKGMYDKTPKAAERAFGGSLNLKRYADMQTAMQAAGFQCSGYRMNMLESLSVEPIKIWRDSYSDEDLRTRVGIFYGVGSGS